MLDELARQREALAPARDRLMTTIFLVAALHALVILGVTFTGPPLAAGHDAPTLEVLLVHNPVAEAEVNTAADYLAQVNQHGAGTGEDVRHAESPHALPAADGNPDADDGTGRGAAAREAEREADLLATAAAARDRRYFAHGAPDAAGGSPLVEQTLAPETPGADTSDELRLRGQARRELFVTPNSRESSVAVYLDSWRHKIERIGTANYPLEAVRREGLTGNPVLEVQILASGRLGGAFIKRSSGHPELDAAAIAILKLATPFEPFPRSLAAQHDALRLTYEWQFSGGELRDSTVRMPSNTR